MNFNAPEKYLKSIKENGNAMQAFEALTDEKLAWEFISTGLRTIFGFEVNSITERFLDTAKLKTLESEGLLTQTPTHIVPTQKGLSLCDAITKFIFKV